MHGNIAGFTEVAQVNVNEFFSVDTCAHARVLC